MKATIENLKELLSKTSVKNLAFELDINESLKKQGVDSLDLLDFYLSIEESYGFQIPDQDIDKLNTLVDYENYINGRL